MDAGVGRVGELVGQEPALLHGEAASDILEVLGRRRRGVCGHDDLGPNGFEGDALVHRHLFRQHTDQSVASGGGHQGEAHPGVAGRRLDERGTWGKPSVALGVFDDRERDAILDAAAGIEKLAFAEDDCSQTGSDPVEAHHWRPADVVQDQRRILHRRIFARALQHVEGWGCSNRWRGVRLAFYESIAAESACHIRACSVCHRSALRCDSGISNF